MMKKLLTIFILSLLLSFQSMAGGGPDAYGYVWFDDTDTSAVTYSWIDITSKPGVVSVPVNAAPGGLGDDNSAGPFSIGFDFHYYWADFNMVRLGSNGWVSFGNTGNIASCFPTISNTSSPHNYMAPFMSDLNCGPDGATPNPGSVFYWTNNADTFIVSYINVPFWTQTSAHTGSNTFQVILTNTDSSVTFQYGAVEQSLTYPCNGTGTTDWKFVQGIKAINGTTGLQVNATQDNLPADNSAVKFFYPDSILLQIEDASAFAALNIENGGQFLMKDDKFVPQAYVANVGNVDITTPTTVNAVVPTLGYTSSVQIPAILKGQTFLVQFPDTLTAINVGGHSFNLTISNSNDANPTNNSNSTSISVVEPDGNGHVRLTYIEETTPGGLISWGGAGQDGAGIKIDPPYYPMVIRGIEHFVTADPNSTGYTGGVRLPDPNGDPGPSVANVVVPAGQVNLNAWHRVDFQDSVKIDSSFIYVEWLQGGAGTTLGAETPGAYPPGNRTFEVIAGSWAPYRTAGSDAFIAIYIDTATTTMVGIQDVFEGNVSLYPNPSTGLFTVSGEVKVDGQLNWVITDQLGRKVKSVSSVIQNGRIDTTIDLHGQPSGIYYLVLGQSSGQKVFKLVKK